MNRTHHHENVDNIVIYHCIRIYHCPNVIIIFVIHINNVIIGISSMIVLVNVVQMGVVVMSTTVVIVIISIFLIVIATIVLVLQMGEIVEERPAVDNCQPGLTSRYHRHFPNAIFIGIIVKENHLHHLPCQLEVPGIFPLSQDELTKNIFSLLSVSPP